MSMDWTWEADGLTLGVDVDKALANSLVQMGRDVRDQGKEEGITLLRPTTLEPAGLHVRNGVLGDVHVPYDRIARLEEVAFRPRRQRGGRGAL